MWTVENLIGEDHVANIKLMNLLECHKYSHACKSRRRLLNRYSYEHLSEF